MGQNQKVQAKSKGIGAKSKSIGKIKRYRAKSKSTKAKSNCIKDSVYIDLGKTGTNFAREGFERMMQDVRQGKINCIIVKDFSRFGRNHIETGNYIEKIFPFLGVRFIAVTDCFDSGKYSGLNEDMMSAELKNLVNEMYAKDISLKVRSAKQVKREQGSYTGGIPPYGYQTVQTGGKKILSAEQDASYIVRKIYDLFVSGQNMRQIKVWLYEQKVHRPKDYRRYGHIYWQEGDILQEWSVGTIKAILSNPVYTGCLVQGLTCGKDAAKKKRHEIEKSDWSVKEHTHEAIIDKNMFMQSALRFEKTSVYSNKKGFSKSVPLTEDIFSKVLYCGECGANMSRTYTVKKLGSKDNVRCYHYYCRKSERIDVLKCREKYISYETLADLVKIALRQQISLSSFCEDDMIQMNAENRKKQKKQYAECQSHLQRKIENIQKSVSEQYAKYRTEKISLEKFCQIRNEQEAAITELEHQKEYADLTLKMIDNRTEKNNVFWKSLFSASRNTELTKEVIRAFIHRIEIYSDDRVKIIFAMGKFF